MAIQVDLKKFTSINEKKWYSFPSFGKKLFFNVIH